MTPIDPSILQARYAGTRAAHGGRTLEQNPHKEDHPDLQEAWEDGWRQKTEDLER